ncbi:T9SS type A sorting domain-containing protein [Flavisolibacter sp. BT320]|nr:T9SS type A sorting domain-containing protein [Flavisolibacter longurius]
MKKLILPLVAFLCLSMNVLAQNGTGACKVYGFTLQYISVEPSASGNGKYDLKVNLSWDIEMNTGNKYSYFHIWEAASYTPFNYANKSTPPKAADLSSTLTTIVIKDPSTNPTIVGTYNPDPLFTNVLQTLNTGSRLSRELLPGTSIERFTIENLLIPGVTYNEGGTYNFTGDIWSSQHNQGANVHCSMSDNDFVVNDVVSQSLFRCNDDGLAGLVNVTLKSTQPSATGTYRIFIDTDKSGSFNASSDTPLGSELSFTTSSSSPLSNEVDFPYEYKSEAITIPNEYNGKMIWLVVSLTGKSNQVFDIRNSCAPLPVTFGAFTASRKGNTVAVKWQTSFEQNVSGFNVQRITSGNWTTVAFVPAKNLANGGSYELTDINTYSGLSQYRIQSVDIDGKQKLSEVRSVRGEASSTRITVYPNPTTTGRLTLVFDNNSVRDISVLDMSGRIVKQLQSQRSNNISLEIMQDGLYQVQIIDRTTGELTAEKIIVKKR